MQGKDTYPRPSTNLSKFYSDGFIPLCESLCLSRGRNVWYLRESKVGGILFCLHGDKRIKGTRTEGRGKASKRAKASRRPVIGETPDPRIQGRSTERRTRIQYQTLSPCFLIKYKVFQISLYIKKKFSIKISVMLILNAFFLKIY